MKRISVFFSVLLVFSLLIFLTALSEIDSTKKLRVSFLNVGQGDSILISAPNGNKVIVDSGPRSGVVQKEYALNTPWYSRAMELVLSTHAHDDHYGGAEKLAERYGSFAYSGAYDLPGVQHIDLETADRIDIGGGAYLEVLRYDDKLAKGKNPHRGSMVSRVVYGKTSFLLTADIDFSVEKDLVKKYGEKMKSNVLKVTHHGSKTGTSDSFLKIIDPQYAVISVGDKNRFGHPTEEALSRLAVKKIPVLRTDILGTICFESDGEKVTLISQ